MRRNNNNNNKKKSYTFISSLDAYVQYDTTSKIQPW